MATYAVIRHKKAADRDAEAALEEGDAEAETTVESPSITAALRRGFTRVISRLPDLCVSG
jgi:hypothetical protein